jgi:formylglycine-generating enzyme required for sulfatase activity
MSVKSGHFDDLPGLYMKITALVFAAAAFLGLFPACRTSGAGTGVPLDEAIRLAAEEISASFEAGAVVAVINFTAPSQKLSGYVIEELAGALVRAKKLVVADRSNLALIQDELRFQFSGEVSDESAQAIGKKLGARAIITGSLVEMNGSFRFRVYALNVESAARETATLVSVRSDEQLRFLLAGEPGPGEPGAAPAFPQGSAASPAAAPGPSAPPAPSAPLQPAPPSSAFSGNFVLIPGGTFRMGSPASEADRDEDEAPHEVTVSAFYMGKYEVTQSEYEEVMGSNPSHAKGANLPVETVSWDDAVEYCNRRSLKEGLTPVYTRSGDATLWNTKADGCRLPTEAEWEYACRAGTTGPFSTGNNITTHEANYHGRRPYNGNAAGMYRGTTMPVGSFPSNPWGLYEMHGNVIEWCWDWYAPYSAAPQKDPQGPSQGKWNWKTARGGAWDWGGYRVRSAVRFTGEAFTRLNNVGFRVARSRL